MKKRYFLLLTGILLLTASLKGQAISNEAFLSRWSNTESYVMEMIQSVPDSLLDYKPVDSVFTIREQFVHIHNHLNYIHSNFLDPEAELKDWDLPNCDKLCLEQKLASSFKRIRKTVMEDMDISDLNEMHFFHPAGRKLSEAGILYLLLDHTKHHTGQLVVYLRLNGIAPPRYTGW